MNERAASADTDPQFRLVGIGKSTSGVEHRLTPGPPVVVGRHADCTIALANAAEDAEHHLSRHHAVLEYEETRGWCVYDSGSTNGTAVLHGGFPPAVLLQPGIRHWLRPDDVIELAGTPELRLAFQRAPESMGTAPPAADPRTAVLGDCTQPSLQLLLHGIVRLAMVVDSRGVAIGGPDTGVERHLPVPGVGRTATAVLRGETVVLHCSGDGLRLNLEALAPQATVALRDRDLLTLASMPDVAILYLDPRAISLRNLSDLLVDADRIVIGSAPTSSCRLLDPSVSRAHAEVWRDGDRLLVRDLGSANGTTVGGQRIHDITTLEAGTRMSIGRLRFVVDRGCWPDAARAVPSVDVRMVNASVEIAGKLRLRNVSLGVSQGEMVGLLGPSASGKSTLLKALAGRQRLASGAVYVNGRLMGPEEPRWAWFKGLLGFQADETYDVGFVHQHDVVQPELTVREMLEYAARQMGLAPQEAASRAVAASEWCNLGPLLDRVVLLGTGQMNLSGGQLKRVCVAIEVLRRPRILLLDEPTTGQDPRNTTDLMQLFRALAQKGVTVLISTHDLRTLALFDKVAALCLGSLVYFGPPTTFAPYFAQGSAEDVYDALPDREDRIADAERLARQFEGTEWYRLYCGAAAE